MRVRGVDIHPWMSYCRAG